MENSIDIKPDTLYDKDTVQNTTNISTEFKIDIYNDKDNKKIYTNETKSYIFTKPGNVEIKLNKQQLNNLYTSEVVYEPNVEKTLIERTYLVWQIIIIIQVIIMIYFVYRIIKMIQERRGNDKSNNS